MLKFSPPFYPETDIRKGPELVLTNITMRGKNIHITQEEIQHWLCWDVGIEGQIN